MSNPPDAISTVAIPTESALIRHYKTTHFSDAYAVELRDLLVAGFGLKTAVQLARVDPAGKVRRIGIFRIYSTSAQEIVLGEDDRHLDFRLSVFCTAPGANGGPHRLTLSTVVHCHNRLGRLYILLIAPFHRAVVRSSLRRAARTGWPKV